MCGIFAILGIHNCYSNILDGLQVLQNRGYDSAGVCSMINNKLVSTKFVTDQEDSIKKLSNKDIVSLHDSSFFSISHTRWATHGPKTQINSHPHLDNTNCFSIVHNGIIENYKELKSLLVKKNFSLKSQTDTEILVNLISYNYSIMTMVTCKRYRIIKSIQLSLEQCKGTMGVCLMSSHTPNTLYTFRRGSPLVFSMSLQNVIIASEQSPLQKYCDQYVIPDENTVVTFTLNSQNVIESNISLDNFNVKNIEKSKLEDTPYPYEHWTLKEINSIPHYIKECLHSRIMKDSDLVNLKELDSYKELIVSKKYIYLIGCGSSLYAAKFVRKYFSQLKIYQSIECINACEFDFDDYTDERLKQSMFILISQSGETYDLIKILNMLNTKQLFSVGIVNKVGSYISTHTTCTQYIKSGHEVGVAATKSYINQVITLLFLGLYVSQYKHKESSFHKSLINSIKRLSCYDVPKITNIQSISNVIKDQNNMFVLGTHFTEHIAQEGSLKIKELTYIHCESYSMGELKHGPLSLIFDKIPIIYFCLRENDNTRLRSSLSETKIRDSVNIVITDFTQHELCEKLDMETVDHVIYIDYYGLMSPLLSVIPLQILSYYVSISKGINPDKPRNLAKTVTVE